MAGGGKRSIKSIVSSMRVSLNKGNLEDYKERLEKLWEISEKESYPFQQIVLVLITAVDSVEEKINKKNRKKL
jgi:hypothetical protein